MAAGLVLAAGRRLAAAARCCQALSPCFPDPLTALLPGGYWIRNMRGGQLKASLAEGWGSAKVRWATAASATRRQCEARLSCLSGCHLLLSSGTLPRTPLHLSPLQTFGIMGGLYAAVSCFMQRLRQKNDGGCACWQACGAICWQAAQERQAHLVLACMSLFDSTVCSGLGTLRPCWHSLARACCRGGHSSDCGPSQAQPNCAGPPCSLEWRGIGLCHGAGAGLEAGAHQRAAGGACSPTCRQAYWACLARGPTARRACVLCIPRQHPRSALPLLAVGLLCREHLRHPNSLKQPVHNCCCAALSCLSPAELCHAGLLLLLCGQHGGAARGGSRQRQRQQAAAAAGGKAAQPRRAAAVASGAAAVWAVRRRCLLREQGWRHRRRAWLPSAALSMRALALGSPCCTPCAPLLLSAPVHAPPVPCNLTLATSPCKASCTDPLPRLHGTAQESAEKSKC